MSLKTLMVVGLPRSLTTVVYTHAARALSLRQPLWTTAGEILNQERCVLAAGMQGDGLRYTRPDERFRTEQLHSWLDQCVPQAGHAFKDVVQPLALSSWPGLRQLAVLYVRRDPGEVAAAMRRVGWRYPARAGSGTDPLQSGLERAAAALSSVADVTVDFSTLLFEEEALSAALRRLYPRTPVVSVHYMSDDFLRKRSMQASLPGAPHDGRQPVPR